MQILALPSSVVALRAFFLPPTVTVPFLCVAFYSNMVDLVVFMISVFSEDPPVYAVQTPQAKAHGSCWLFC